MAILTDQDKQFILRLKEQGYSKEDAFAALTKVKQAKGDQTFSFGERFMQNLKAAPAALFGEESVSQKILGSVPIVGDALNSVPRAIEDTSDMAIHGTETTVKGVGETAVGLKDMAVGTKTGLETGDWSDFSDATVDTVGGTTKIIGGGLETVFSPVIGAATNAPIVGEPIEKGLEIAGEGIDWVATQAGDALGTDEESKRVIKESVTNLAMLLGTKYGPRAVEQLKTTLSPYVVKAGETIKSKMAETPKVQMGEPVPEVTKLATEQGVDLPISATTGSEFVRSVEALQKNGIFSGDLLKKSAAATEKITENVNKAVERLETSDVSKFDFGNMAKEGFEKVKDDFRSTKNDLYDVADVEMKKAGTLDKPLNQFDDPSFFLKNSNTVLEDLITSGKKSLTPTSSIGFWEKLKNGLNGRGLTIDHFRQTLKDIGKKMGDNNDPITTGDRAALGKVYGAMAKDLDAVYMRRAPAFAEAIKTANNFYKTNIELINSKFGSMVERATPEQIYEKFVKPNNPTALGELKQIIGDEGFAKISGVFVKDLLEKSVKNEKFSIESFNKELSKWDSETLKTILNKDQLARLEEVKSDLGASKTLQDAMKAGEAKFKGSQTGFLNAVNKLKTLILPGGTVAAGFLGGPAMIAISAAMYILGDFATARLLKSDFMKKLVSTGVEVPGAGKAKAIGEFITKNADAISEIMSGTAVGVPVAAPTSSSLSSSLPQEN